MTPEQIAEAEAFRDSPVSPAAQACSDAQVALAALYQREARRFAAELERLRLGEPCVRDAFDLLWGLCAAEHGRALALGVAPPGIEEALDEHGLRPAIAHRAANLRPLLTN